MTNQCDPDTPEYPAQFGVDRDDVISAVKLLNEAKLRVNIIHFHLRSNVPSLDEYTTAAAEVAAVCQHSRLEPPILDVGGGLHDEMIGVVETGSTTRFGVEEYVRVIANCADKFPSLKEVWFENGRYLVSACAALIITVRDAKRIRGFRFLICDGGRTNHALESDWSTYTILPLGAAKGVTEPTIICGPTCMAYDWVYRGPFASDVKPGDRLIYLNAGAYHLPWETRFSHGLCNVAWTEDGEKVEVIRAAKSFDQWIRQWNVMRRPNGV